MYVYRNRISETKNTEKETDQGVTCCRKAHFSVKFAETICFWSL